MFQMHQTEQRSITSLCVVEDITKAPLGYTTITRTHDTETDADLGKDGGFFSKRLTRYVCASKSQGKPEHVIQDILILHDKEAPPNGYTLIQLTSDSNQKAFKKKHICFKQVHYKHPVESISDIILRSKVKNPPDGYDNIGEINGLHFFVKKISALTRLSAPGTGYVPYNPSPMNANGSSMYPSLQDSLNSISLNANSVPQQSNGHRFSLPHERMMQPSQDNNSPANLPNVCQYPNKASYNTATLSHLLGVEGVPFILRNDLIPKSMKSMSFASPKPFSRIKNVDDLQREYQYDFNLEREVLAGQM